MKEGIKDIISKTVAGVVIARNETRQPHEQIFLILDDDTSYEIYGDDFTCAGGVESGGIESALRYEKIAPGAEIMHVYLSNGVSHINNCSFFGQSNDGKYLN